MTQEDNVVDLAARRDYRKTIKQIAEMPSAIERDFAIDELKKTLGRGCRIESIREEVAATIAALNAEEKDKPSADGRICVSHVIGRPDLNADACIEAMKSRGALVYRRGNNVVRVEGAGTNDPTLSTIDSNEAMVEAISPHVVYRDGEGNVGDVPPNVARTIFKRTRSGLYTIQNLVRAPMLRPDCSILNTPGYDPETRMFYAPKPGFIMPDVSARPTFDEALAARDVLLRPIACFPFKPVDRAVALSGMLIAGGRGALGNAPLTLIDAETAGSGKGKYAQVMAAIALGERAAAVPPGHDKKELAKRVVARLLTGTSFIYLDNLEQALGGADLCSVLTESPVNLRRLGVSEEGLIDAKIIAVATGNGLRAIGDMTRRAQVMSIEWGLEDPSQQEFAFDPGKLALQMRGELLAATFTILRAYVCAGMPGRLKHVGSFEEWSDLIRSALVWLGEADPAESIFLSCKNAEDKEQLQRLAHEWLAAFVEPVGHHESHTQFGMYLAEEQREGYPEGARTLEQVVRNGGFDHSDLAMIMRQIAPGVGKPGGVDAQALGRWLGGNRAPFSLTLKEGGEAAQYRFNSKIGHGTKHVWWVERCSRGVMCDEES